VHYVFLTRIGSQFTHTRPSPCGGPGKLVPEDNPIPTAAEDRFINLNAVGKRAAAIGIGAAVSRTHVAHALRSLAAQMELHH
jgi:hypothetical protein